MKSFLIFSVYVLLAILLLLTIYNHLPEMKIPQGTQIDKILVEKSKRRMHIYSNDILIKSYRISLGPNPIGDKEFEGDGKTPTGIYKINDKNPNSNFHLNLGISYPNAKDVEEANKLGKNAGGDIKIHGLKNGYGFIGKLHRFKDWTQGCIAVTNQEIEELYELVKIGAVIEIVE